MYVSVCACRVFAPYANHYPAAIPFPITRSPMLRYVSTRGAPNLIRPVTAPLIAAMTAPLVQRRYLTMTEAEAQILDLREKLGQVRERCAALEQAHHTDQMIRFYASLQRTKLDISKVVETCRDPSYRQDIFCFRELPVLAAHMITMIDHLPSGLFAMRQVDTVRKTLCQVFWDLTHVAHPDSPAATKAFLKVVDGCLTLLEPTVETMARGVLELRKMLSQQSPLGGKSRRSRSANEPPPGLQESLDEFYLTLTQFKFLAIQLQTCASAQQSKDGEACQVGIVSTAIDLADVARRAARNACMVCTEHHGDCPEINIEIADGEDGRATISHLHDHLDYVLVELLKNSLRATVDTHMKRNSLGFVDCSDMPPVTVRIATNKSKETATVVVSDQGGGIPREDMSKIMSYTFTSTNKNALDGDAEPTLLAGYGYGLPMSRIHARLFGGDLTLQSVEGYGTDAYLFLKKK